MNRNQNKWQNIFHRFTYNDIVYRKRNTKTNYDHIYDYVIHVSTPSYDKSYRNEQQNTFSL